MALIKLPGLIDVHVHIRDPGQTYKEDFFTATQAALVGGFTTIIDMPNNKAPITDLQRLEKKIKEANKKIVCDVGLYAGSVGEDLDKLMKMEPYVFGLKLYLNQTTGNFIINEEKLKRIFRAWKSNKPILVHAESNIIDRVIHLVIQTRKKVHICHISTKYELKTVIKAKEKKLPLTFGVTPHHLFLSFNEAKRLGSFGLMKPPIDKEYQKFVWKNLDYVDCVESDHAPHTIEEKKSATPPFGVPGLETTLPLLLTAVSQGKLTMKRLLELCFYKPKEIFNIKTDKNTWVEVDLAKEYIINNKNLKTKCGWSPFTGWEVKGKIKKVFLRGKKVFENDKLLVKRSFGKIIFPKII